jgi:BASS family bile acid:Na+ symporter
MSLEAIISMVLRASVVLTVFALALGISAEHRSHRRRNPAKLGRSLLAMYVVMPVVGVGLAVAFALSLPVKVALVALSVSPVPPLLPRKQLGVGGHATYAMWLLGAAALLAIVFVPGVMALLGVMFNLQGHVSVVTVAKLVTVTVLAPLVAGMLVRYLAPSLAEPLSAPVSRIATLLLVAGLVPVLLASGPAILSLIGNGTVLALAAFSVAGLAAGHLLGGPEAADRVVLALATATRHPGVSVAIASAAFPEQKLVGPAVALYLIVTTLVSALYIAWVRRRYPGMMSSRATPAPSKRPAA